MTSISDVMTRGVRTLSPKDTVMLAAQAMEELDIGSIPVCDGKKLVGMVTDRDIVLRGVAQGLSNEETRLDQVMTTTVCWCFEDQSVDEVMEQMRESQLRRVPVVDRDKRLVGVVSLGDLAVKADQGKAGDTLASISEPAAPSRGGQSRASGPAGGGASEPHH